MKKTIFAIFILLLGLNVSAEDAVMQTWSWWSQSVNNNSVEWEVWIYQNAKALEFILNIEWSALLESLKTDKSRLWQWDDWTYFVKNVKRNEEKIAMKLTNWSWQSMIYTNFDPPKWANYIIKRFDQIDLIKHSWQIKAKVIIYLHPEIDISAAKLFLTKDSEWREVDNVNYNALTANTNIKTVAYIYMWLNNKKMWRVIKIK